MDKLRQSHAGFTLVELLVVLAIITLLVSLTLPALASGRQSASAAKCLVNLRSLGQAGTCYQSDYKDSFWPMARYGWPTGANTYFWGSATHPVNRQNSWLLRYIDYASTAMLCPDLPWGSYVPQGGVNEPTTCYGYNAWCLDPAVWGRRIPGTTTPMPRKRVTDILSPSKLFVFADSGMSWSPGGVVVFQNSTSLDPVNFGSATSPNNTPTTHFRHLGRTQALNADGSARAYDNEGGKMLQPSQSLGFVGADNAPHYDQP